MPDQTPIPAATVVVFRDRGDGPPELLIVERAKQLVFAGGMLAFPGGRIDPGDRALAATPAGAGAGAGDSDGEELAARIAAIRECIEEAGVPVGLDPPPDAAGLAAIRAALHGGATIAAALNGIAIVPEALVPFARWRPDHPHARIFDTRFYLARFPPAAPAPSVDATENARLFWASAADVLAMCDRGEAAVIFPTRRNLERLAQFASFAEAAAHAAATPVVTVTPWIAGEGDARRLRIPENAGYPVTSELLSTALRG